MINEHSGNFYTKNNNISEEWVNRPFQKDSLYSLERIGAQDISYE